MSKRYAKGVAVNRSVPGAIEGKAEQGPDYAPKWFRDSGDIAGGAAAPFRTMGYEQTKKVMEAVQKGIAARKAAAAPAGGARPAKVKKTRVLSDRQRARNALISKLTREKGMSLPEASRYIKEHGLV